MDYLKSNIRHWLTGVFTLAVVWLSATFALPEADQQALTKAFSDITGSLLVIVVVLAPVLGRFLLTWISTIFRTGSGEPTDKTAGKSGGASLWCVLGTAAGLMTILPSCTSAQWDAARAVPIKGCYVTDQGKVCYGPKSGLEFDVDGRSAK